MQERICCITAGCDRCSEGVCTGTNFWGDKLYRCSAYNHKHKKVDAINCENFKCKNPIFISCSNCIKKGK